MQKIKNMLDSVSGLLIFLSVISAMVITLSLVAGLILYTVNSIECANYSKMTKRNTEMSFLTCYVEHDNIMIPKDEYIARITASQR